MRVIRALILDPASQELVIVTALVPDDVDLSSEEIAAIASAMSSPDSAGDDPQELPPWLREFLQRTPNQGGPQQA